MKGIVALVAVGAILALAAPVGAAVAPVAWCGTERTAADRTPDRAGGEQIHVAYVVPADAEDRFDVLASALVTDIAAVDGWWRREDPTRAPRFDLFEFPSCGSRFGRVDLGFVRLPQTAAFYAQQNTFAALAVALAQPPIEFALPSKKYLVFYDGLGRAEDEHVCGTASGAPGTGGAGSLAIVFLRAGCNLDVGRGAGNAAVAAHELLHMLGALPPGAPNACPDDDGHPCDDPRDILWPVIAADVLEQTILDVGRNDYYGHAGGWFDVQDSAWLLDAQRQVELTTSVTGRGTVRDGTTFECTTTCWREFDAGTEVVLDAEPAAGYLFRGWSGSCAGRGRTCTLTVGGNVTVAATFRRAVRLQLAVRGRGAVVAPTARCTRTCAVTAAVADVVALRAVAARGWRFARWRGACRGARPRCTARVTSATRAEAVFVRR